MTKKEAERILKNTPMQGNIDCATGREDLYKRGYTKGFLERDEQMRHLVEALKDITRLKCHESCFDEPCDCGSEIAKEALAKFKETEGV